MNQVILKRLIALEKRPSKPKQFDQLEFEQRALSETQLSREQFMAKFGGFPGYAYLKMIKGDGSPPKAIPQQYRTPQEYYFKILKNRA